MSSNSNKTWQWLLSGAALVGVVLCCFVLAQTYVYAAAGINQQLNFQGRLLNSSGATVPDGIYNIEFKIYQDGDGQSVGDTTGSPAGALKWTENHLVSTSSGVTVQNGYFSVQLGSVNPFGSSINWNQDTLWLSVDIGNTSSCTITTTFDANCGGDGEMTPMKRLSSTPYALNAGQLGGLTSAQFVQLAQGLQTDASTNTNSIYINKTGSGGNFIDLQASGTDAFTLTNAGDITFGANARHTLSVAASAAGVAGNSLTIVGGAAGSGSAVVGGNLILQGGAGSGTGASGSVIVKSNGNNSPTAFQVQNASAANIFTVDTTNTAIVLGNDGAPTALTVRGGAATGSNAAGANITFDASNGTGVSGSGAFIFRTAAGDNNTVTYDNSAKATDGGGCAVNTLTLGSYTMTSNANPLLFVSVVTNRTVALNSTTGVQWKVGTTTQNMTRLDFGDTTTGSPGFHLELWYLTAPTSGSGSVIVNTTGTNSCIEVTATSYYNVNQTTPLGTEAKASNNTSPTSNSVSSNITQLVYDTIGSDNVPTGSNVSGNVRQIESNALMDSVQDKAASSGTTAMGWVDPFSDWIEMTVPVNPAVDSNPNTLTDRLHITAGGNVGIDTASPQYALDVTGSGNFSTAAYAPLFDTATETTLNIGTTKTNAVLIGNTTGATSVTLQAGTGGIKLNSATSVAANFTVTNAGTVAFQRGTDFSTTGTSNNVNFGSGTVIRLTGASAQTITGIAGGIDGRVLTLVNAASQAATISNLNAGSTSANQINTGTSSDVTLPAGSAMYLMYDGGTNVWRIVGSSGGGVQLQSGTPGIQQVGNFNINGTGIASSFDSASGGTLGLGTTNATAINVGVSTGTGTITLQQSGITEKITGSATAPTDIIKTTTNSTGAFQVQDSGSARVLGVDTVNDQVLLGQSSTKDGTLVFKNHTNTNAITINSTNTNASYSLTLPSAAPATGLCLETSSANANLLVFASCSNNNTSISEVQEVDANNTNVTPSFSPFSVGDVIVVTTQIPTSSVTVTGVSGGGVTTWTKAVANNGNGTVNRVEMWIGTVTSLGSTAVTVTYSSSPGAEEVTATEFTAAGVNNSTSWGIESTASQLNSTASTTVTYPNLIPINGAELYFGYAQVQNPPAAAGSTTGFSYIQTSTQHNMIAYNPSTAANTPYQPTASQSLSGQSNTIGAILTAFVTSTSINNATSIQKANFYVQAATAGSVAGVLQAASSGSADILNLRNSSSANVMTVGNTGATLFKNSTDSSTAFQIQNTSSQSIFDVSTSGNTVLLGTAGALGGSLTFNDAGDSNTITLKAPTSIASSYQLALPTNTPTAGLCLGTSPSNATQLIFASCATQVSAASISYVNKWDNHGTSVTTISDAPASIGNLIVFFSHTANTVNINSISGGGVTSWNKVTAYSAGGTPGNIEMWRGVVTTAGAGTITVTYSATAGTNEIVAEEFSMGSSNGTWAIDTSGTSTTTSSVTTVNYPSLTPLNSNELYAGYAYGGGTMSVSSPTSGFTYVATGATKYLTYDTSVTGGTAYAPVAQQTASVYASVAALIEAYVGTSVIVNSTAAQQANFNVQAATSGSVAGILQAASSGTADILQARDSSGNNILSVNGSAINSLTGVVNGVTLGTAGTVAGQLTFAASGNSNTISIVAPSTPGASYYLTLPTTTPAAGQCLATSPNSANQLVFSSCANQVTSVSISFVNNWKGTSNANPATLSTSPVNVGDLMVLFVSFNKADTVGGVSNPVSGGGCGTSWSKVAATSSGSGTDTQSIEIWRCQVTSTGSSPISVNWSGSAGTHELAAMEFTTGSTSGSWVVDASNAQYNGTSSTTVSYPNITPQSTKDLYVGYAAAANTMSAGATTGFTYIPGSLGNRYGLYNTSVSAAVGPVANQSVSGVSIAAGALIAAYSSSSVISNSTVTQEANFNIQAATTGSVAGVLQAAASGSADVLDILNASGTVVDSFSSTGNLLIQPSTASANALRVQTALGVNVLSVDTSALQVVVGAGSTGEATPTLLVLDSQTGSSADPTGVNGAMYYNKTTHTLRCYVDGAWQTCTGSLYSNTSSSSAVNNCTNNCAAFSISAPIPANYCQTGRVFNIVAGGYFSSTGSPNLQFGLYYGTNSTTASSDTLIGVLSPASTVTSASSNAFQINDTVICFSTSSMMAQGMTRIQTGAAAAGMTVLPMSTTSGTTVSTTSAANFYIFPIWDTASTSNTAVLTQLTVNAY